MIWLLEGVKTECSLFLWGYVVYDNSRDLMNDDIVALA